MQIMQMFSGLINVQPVYSRKPMNDGVRFHNSSYSYRMKALVGDYIRVIKICYKGFIAIHGITSRRIQTIQKSLASQGIRPKDTRAVKKGDPAKSFKKLKPL